MNNISLGFSVGHSRGAAITIGGELKVAITNERITRIKTDHSDRLPMESIDYCLTALGLTYNDVDTWVWNTTEENADVPGQFNKMIGVSLDKLHFLPHHLAHAYSSYYASGFKESAIIVADAMGSIYNDDTPIKEWYTLDTSDLKEDQQLAEGFSIYHFKEGKNKPEAVYKKWVHYPFSIPHEGSIGYFYGLGAKQLVYDEKHHSWSAGKLMGLASYARKSEVNKVDHKSTRTDNDLQVPCIPIEEDSVDYKSDFQAKADIAGLYQREQELNSLHLAKMAKSMTGSDSLCVAGGSFLNCNTNELIIKEELFKNNYFMPPADDTGIAIGCVFYGATKLNPKVKFSNTWMSPYLGITYTDEDIEQAVIENEDVVYAHRMDYKTMIQVSSTMLLNNKVIGWFQGGSETGPRALGNRSIIANPSKKWIVEYINSEIKKREWYRPFAPSVLYEEQGKIFELDTYSPYMLVTTKVKKEWQDKIPAVTHFDGTSRYQSVTPNNNKIYYDVINAFYKKSGIPVVLNTSFNGAEEPIVETPADAIKTMFKNNLYAVVINNYVVYRK